MEASHCDIIILCLHVVIELWRILGFNCIWYLCDLQQVLKKADMIRKNAVESILAERDILISVRNPFVVSKSSSHRIFFFAWKF